MRDSIAAYKENLSRIANEFLDAADDELEASPHRGPSNGVDYPASSGRRTSRRFVRSSAEGSPNGSTIANGIDSGSQDEIAKYKADILKLQTSEAEIRALSFNYAAMLKDKEEELSKLREENFSLKNHLDVTNGHALRDESSSKISSASSNVVKGSVDRSSIRKQKSLSQENSHYMGNNMVNGSPSKQDSRHNGGLHKSQYDLMQQKLELKSANSAVIEKGYPDLLEENNKFVAAQTLLESNIKQLKAQLENEHGNTAILKQKLQEEHQLNESSQRELHNVKLDKEQISVEMKELKKELKEKISEIGRLEAECRTSISQKESNHSLERLKDMVKTLEKENEKLKTEKEELVENLKHCRNNSSEKSSNLQEVTAEMRVSIRNLEDTLKHACKERDKALQELARLKQHLLEKELEDSDKMDEDSKMIEELRANCQHQRAHILQLEKSLKLEISKREDLKKLKSDELQRSNEIINDLRQKFATSMSLLDSRNVELLNLQTALGQYYAESEAKDRLGRDLALAREESAKLSESLKVANQEQEMGRRENKDLAVKLAQAERLLSEGKWSMQKLEEDNLKLRRALDQSMTRLNRMSLDSDNYVDRRIVIKLLVTYFQRNHSKEVLDLIVRMLGFSEEDKQRIGFAQTNASKGVVRGVLGLPGRLVGGILGVGSVNSSSLASDNQSFADLWVDFLLKETEERERRELSEAAKLSSGAQEKSAISARLSTVPHNGATFSTVQLSTK